jgi:hypothetical protein
MRRVSAAEADTLAALWRERDDADEEPALADRLQPLIDRLLRAVLAQLYPRSPVPEG